jgi:hypothetical protein
MKRNLLTNIIKTKSSKEYYELLKIETPGPWGHFSYIWAKLCIYAYIAIPVIVAVTPLIYEYFLDKTPPYDLFKDYSFVHFLGFYFVTYLPVCILSIIPHLLVWGTQDDSSEGDYVPQSEIVSGGENEFIPGYEKVGCLTVFTGILLIGGWITGLFLWTSAFLSKKYIFGGFFGDFAALMLINGFFDVAVGFAYKMISSFTRR